MTVTTAPAGLDRAAVATAWQDAEIGKQRRRPDDPRARTLLTAFVVVRAIGFAAVLGAVIALVTGVSGDGDHPAQAAYGSLWSTRWLVCFAIVLVLAVVYDTVQQGHGPVPAIGRARRAALDLFGSRVASRKGARPAWYTVLLGLAIVIPLGLSTAAQQSAVNDVGIYALLALGLNVVVGWAGLLDLGFIAFFAIGAYTTGYFTSSPAPFPRPMPWHAPFVLNPFFVFPVALIVAALAGVILGGPTLRLRGDYLAIVTLGFGEIVQLLANNAEGVTNGARGVFGVPHLSIHLGGFHYEWGLNPLPYYYLLLGLIVVVMIAFSRLERSRTGRAWAAIREDEVAAEASGIPTLRYKLLAFAIGASTSGFAGVLFGTKQFFNPQSFSFQASILVLTIVIFGGMGSIFGVVIGSVVLQGLAFELRDRVPAQDRYIYFGAVVILMMIVRPQGLLPSRRRSREIRLSEEGIGSADSLGTGSVNA